MTTERPCHSRGSTLSLRWAASCRAVSEGNTRYTHSLASRNKRSLQLVPCSLRVASRVGFPARQHQEYQQAKRLRRGCRGRQRRSEKGGHDAHSHSHSLLFLLRLAHKRCFGQIRRESARIIAFSLGAGARELESAAGPPASIANLGVLSAPPTTNSRLHLISWEILPAWLSVTHFAVAQRNGP